MAADLVLSCVLAIGFPFVLAWAIFRDRRRDS